MLTHLLGRVIEVTILLFQKNRQLAESFSSSRLLAGRDNNVRSMTWLDFTFLVSSLIVHLAREITCARGSQNLGIIFALNIHVSLAKITQHAWNLTCDEECIRLTDQPCFSMISIDGGNKSTRRRGTGVQSLPSFGDRSSHAPPETLCKPVCRRQIIQALHRFTRRKRSDARYRHGSLFLKLPLAGISKVFLSVTLHTPSKKDSVC